MAWFVVWYRVPNKIVFVKVENEFLFKERRIRSKETVLKHNFMNIDV